MKGTLNALNLLMLITASLICIKISIVQINGQLSLYKVKMAKKLQNVAKPGYLYYIRVTEEIILQ